MCCFIVAAWAVSGCVKDVEPGDARAPLTPLCSVMVMVSKDCDGRRTRIQILLKDDAELVIHAPPQSSPHPLRERLKREPDKMSQLQVIADAEEEPSEWVNSRIEAEKR